MNVTKFNASDFTIRSSRQQLKEVKLAAGTLYRICMTSSASRKKRGVKHERINELLPASEVEFNEL